MRERLQAIGAEVGGGSVDDFRSFAMSEIGRYRDIVQMSGAPKE
jgi:hypothetical protein